MRTFLLLGLLLCGSPSRAEGLPPAQLVPEGCLLPKPSCVAVAREIKRLQTQNDLLKAKLEEKEPGVSKTVAVSAGVLTFLVGVVVGVKLAR